MIHSSEQNLKFKTFHILKDSGGHKKDFMS